MDLFKVSVESQLPKAIEKLKGIDRAAWPKILRHATNETAFAVHAKYKAELPRYIDRPSPFTINSMFVKKATGSSMDASVQWKDWTGSGSIPAGRYLQPEVFGGTRRQKRSEKALEAAGLIPHGYVMVPTEDAPKDSYGNVPGSLINKILSYLRANPDSMQNRRMEKPLEAPKLLKPRARGYKEVMKRELRRQKKLKKQKPRYFVSIKGRNGSSLPSGIYETVRRSLSLGSGGNLGGQAGGAIRRIFTFVPAASYKISIPFYEIGKARADLKFPEKIDEAILIHLNKK